MTSSQHRSHWGSVLILLLAAALRLHALAHAGRFHVDEALFSTFARNAALKGQWLLPGALDKPPLSLYAAALSLQFVAARGSMDTLLDVNVYQGEFAARLPNTFAGVLLVAVTLALARRLWRGVPAARNARTVALAGLLAALSPFGVAFSATVFTDVLMTLFAALSVWSALAPPGGRWCERRALWAGVWLALAFASKQQALFLLPLVAALVCLPSAAARARAARAARARAGRGLFVLLWLALPVLTMTAALLAWDAVRAQPSTIWGLAAFNNDPRRGWLVPPGDVPLRALLWGINFGAFAGVLTLPLSALAFAAVVRERQPRAALAGAFVLAYLLAHVVVTFNVYDRYLLPLLPLWAALAARGVVLTFDAAALAARGVVLTFDAAALAARGVKVTFGSAAKALAHGTALGLLLTLALAAWDASEGRVGVGGDRGQHDGIDRLAAALNGRALGAIVYDRWLGWQLGYYLGPWTDLRRVYYPTPGALRRGAQQQPDPAPRYLVVPVTEPVAAWLDALREVGFRVERGGVVDTFVVYKLLPPVR